MGIPCFPVNGEAHNRLVSGALDSERTIIVDAMGGDHGPSVCVEGAVQAVLESPRDIQVILVGDEPKLREELATYNLNGSHIEAHHASDVIHMHEPASEGLRRKDSSIRVAMRLLKQARMP